MRYYYAPMEGLTDSIYRKVHHSFFPGLDAYYMPFLSPTVHRCLTNRETRELPPCGKCNLPGGSAADDQGGGGLYLGGRRVSGSGL